MSQDRDPYPYYPFLIAAHSVIALVASNQDERTPLLITSAMLLVAIGFAALAVLVARLLMHERHRGALVASTIVIALLFYGYIWRLVPESFDTPRVRDLVAISAIAIGVATLAAGTRRWPLNRFTKHMNRVSIALVMVSCALAAARQERPLLLLDLPTTGSRPAPLRDIYLIVLDAYTGSTVLATEYGYDNQHFVAALERRGFVVPPEGRANYSSTPLALSAMLNWTYLDTIPALVGRTSKNYAPLHSLIEHNRAARYLRRAGYEFVFFPTTWWGTRRSPVADVNVVRHRTDAPQTSPVVDVWLSNTILPVIRRSMCASEDCRGVTFAAEGAASIEKKFEQLGDVAAVSTAPRFVFAHFLTPHEPFEFNADCTHREPYWPSSTERESADWKAAYVAQVQCVNQQLLRLIDRIRAGSDVTPIILLQGDHGHGRFRGGPPPLHEISDGQLHDRMSAFGAYLLPGATEPIPRNSSPVNLFRLVLRQYFGEDLPPLPDRAFYSSSLRPFDFSEVSGGRRNDDQR